MQDEDEEDDEDDDDEDEEEGDLSKYKLDVSQPTQGRNQRSWTIKYPTPNRKSYISDVTGLNTIYFRVYLFSTNYNICARRKRSLFRLVKSSTVLSVW